MEDIRCFLIEDDPILLNGLMHQLVNDFTAVSIVGTATDVEQAIKGIRQTKPDLVVSDIELDPGTGFDVLDAVKDMDFGVVFLTSHEHYVLKALQLSAIDYIQKPFSVNAFANALKKFRKQKSSKYQVENVLSHLQYIEQPKRIAVPSGSVIQFIDVADIIYIKADASYCHIISEKHKPILVSKSLKEYAVLLSDIPFFLRIHQSYFINTHKVERILKAKLSQVVMSNGDVLPVSRSQKENFEQAMLRKNYKK